jgi:tetratricopeptide (TPR) repeat protein
MRARMRAAAGLPAVAPPTPGEPAATAPSPVDPALASDAGTPVPPADEDDTDAGLPAFDAHAWLEQTMRTDAEADAPVDDTGTAVAEPDEDGDELAVFRGTRERRALAHVWRPAASEDEIDARIARHTPSDAAGTADGWLPEIARAQILSARAVLREQLADYEGARRDYARALELGSLSLSTWRGLARTRVRTGEREAAEAAFLAADRLARGTPGVSPLLRAGILSELGELYLVMGHPATAAERLDRALDLAPGAVRTQRLWTLALSRSEGVEGTDALAEQIPLWPPTHAERWRDGLESGLDALFAHAPRGLRDRVEDSAGAQTAVVLGGVLALLFAAWIAMRLTRKTGDLVVSLSYPDELEGQFSVRIALQAGRHRRLGTQESARSVRRKSTRTAHYGVSRETQFLRLHARRYWVTVQGELADRQGGQVLVEPFEEQSVDVAGNETARLDFDLAPRECPVDVTVLWDKRGAGEVGVVARGLPQSLRYQTNGKVRLRLPMGSHTIVVGSGDRIAECDVEVQSHKPTEVEINLAGSEHLVFKGCPPAVEPYLHGDLNGAARALERDGHESVAHLLLARLHQEQGQTERAAERLERAGHHLEAAKLRESISDFERAATLFENAGNARRAAETWRAAGELEKAGELYQSLGDYTLALACFEEAGATAATIGVLELQGEYFDAARVAMEDGDRARAIRLLQQVPRTDHAYAEACMQLVAAFEEEGHADLAARKLEEYVGVVGAAASPDVYSHLAELLTRGDEPGRALEVLEVLREREPTYPNIASRIEALRKIVSGRRLDEGTAPATTTATLVSDQRYEIIEEIGRGGMGLIFKARDRRLGRIVALKRLPENLREHPKALQLFLNEAQAAARLNHPNIVTIFDTDQEDGTFFITMELLQGMPLNLVLRERGRLGPRDTARIGVQVARGLQYAHDQQIVHRDVKTANLFLTRDKVVKIMDFGLAKIIEEVRRGSTVIGGTPSYMAPEQAAGDRVDHRADLYALGVTLFELVVGRLPFVKGDVAYHHRHTEAPDPRSLANGVPDALAELILELMRKDPAERCGSAGEVEERLDRIVHA